MIKKVLRRIKGRAGLATRRKRIVLLSETCLTFMGYLHTT